MLDMNHKNRINNTILPELANASFFSIYNIQSLYSLFDSKPHCIYEIAEKCTIKPSVLFERLVEFWMERNTKRGFQ